MQDGKAMVTDGPFAETKEQLAGYYILDCRNLDEAIDWAAKIPTACKGRQGCIEIRPMPALPATDGKMADRRPLRSGRRVPAGIGDESWPSADSHLRLLRPRRGGAAGGLRGGARVPGRERESRRIRGAWIMTAAHRKLIDAARREQTRREKQDSLRYESGDRRRGSRSGEEECAWISPMTGCG